MGTVCCESAVGIDRPAFDLNKGHPTKEAKMYVIEHANFAFVYIRLATSVEGNCKPSSVVSHIG